MRTRLRVPGEIFCRKGLAWKKAALRSAERGTQTFDPQAVYQSDFHFIDHWHASVLN